VGTEMGNNIFDITPGTNLIDVLSSSGYTIETAIADIIDNSITAKAKNILVMWDINNKDTIKIFDDGYGMNQLDLKDSIILAKKNIKDRHDLDDLGKFGVGLKTASMSFADKLKIVTKQKNGPYYGIEVDFGKIKSEKKWYANIIDPNKEDQFDYFKSGTCIIWEDIKIENNIFIGDIAIFDKLSKIEEHISHVFGYIIKNKGVKIYINSFDYEVKSYDPFFINKNPKIIQEETIELNNEKIEVISYILPTTTSFEKDEKEKLIGKGLAEQQGFYVYRNDRLVYEGGWLNLEGLKIDNKSNYARIKVNINNRLDYEFKLNFEKSKIQVPETLKNKFKQIAIKAKKASLNNYEYKTSGIKSTTGRNPKNYSKVWIHKKDDKEDRLFINREHQIIKNTLLEESKLEQLLRLIENSIPVNIIQTNNIVDVKFSDKELIGILNNAYQKLKEDGNNFNEINKKLFDLEPFDDSRYQMQILSFLKEKKEIDF
jgi:hypothetical protein